VVIPADFYPHDATRTTLPPLSGAKASQMREELWWLASLIRDMGCRSYLEIGARQGDTFQSIAQVMDVPSRLVAIDWPGAKWGRTGSETALEKAAHVVQRMGHEVDVLIGDSHSPRLRRLTYPPFDAILIDGDHTYEAVKQDWLDYRPLATKLVAFHDIVGEGQTSGGHPVEVPRLWREITAEFPGQTVQCVAPDSRMGIGVWFPSRGG
jgi:predicted O-methyltransferase YrrM